MWDSFYSITKKLADYHNFVRKANDTVSNIFQSNPGI